jgi:hypothetical protein
MVFLSKNKINMIVTEMYKGQGFGNQLFCYVTTRCIALDRGYNFGLVTPENIANNIHSTHGPYFMDLDLGLPVTPATITSSYSEKEVRMLIPQNPNGHDEVIGCDIRLFDPLLSQVPDGCKIDGLMQSEDYFYHRKEEIAQWLRVKPEYDCYDFSQDDICVLHMRYYGNDVNVQLPRDYWVRAIYHMLAINPNMSFLVISNDTEYAKSLLPELAENVVNFDMARDYSIIKNAKYLILGNSSFPFFAAWTNQVSNLTIAPKYWARYNISDGYWSLGCNLYRDSYYMDREGNLQSYDECLREFQIYKKKKLNPYYNR